MTRWFTATAVLTLASSCGHHPRVDAPLAVEARLQAAESNCGSLIPQLVADTAPTVVQVRFGDTDMITGTLISADGIVLTCAHLPVMVGEEVIIGLSDGRLLPATVLSKLPKDGESRSCKDIALLKVADAGPFPYAPVASSSPRELGGTLLALGFPDTLLLGADRTSDPLYVRIGTQIQDPYETCPDEICTTIRGTGGDSGGPLFDLAGRVVGVVHGGDQSGAHMTYTRIEVLRRNWNVLASGRDEPQIPSSTGPDPKCQNSLPATVAHLRSSVVEVHSQSRLVALGTVVGDGLILTKASELGPSLTVVTANDYVAIAEIAATDPDLDLALLRLTYAPELTRGVQAVSWNNSRPVSRGSLVWSVGSVTVAPQLGVACFAPRDIPAIQGFIPCEFEQGDGGVRVVGMIEELRRFRLRPLRMPLRVGDTLLSVEGVPVPTLQEYKALVFSGTRIGTHPPVAGIPLSIRFRRGKDIQDDVVGLEFSQTPTGQLVRPASARYSSFQRVIATDLPARPEHCGTPVVNSEGVLVGMLIARAPFVESIVLPAEQVAGAIERMTASSRPGR